MGKVFDVAVGSAVRMRRKRARAGSCQSYKLANYNTYIIANAYEPQSSVSKTKFAWPRRRSVVIESPISRLLVFSLLPTSLASNAIRSTSR